VLRRPSAVALRRVVLPDGAALQPADKLALHAKQELGADLRCPTNAPVSAPYWLAEPPLPGRHVVRDPRLLAHADDPPPLAARVELVLDGQGVTLDAPIVHVWTDRVHGERERRVLIVPPATVTATREAVMLPNGKRASVTLRVRAGADAVGGRVFLQLPDGFRAEPAEQTFKLERAGDETMLSFALTAAGSAKGGYAVPVVEVAGQRWSYRQDVIDHPHVPLQVVLQPARLRLSPLRITPPRGLIGYIEGPGDSVAADLAHVGAKVEVLDEDTLLQGDLGRFSAIVLGVRAHNTREVLRTAHPRLMRYVEQGGTLLVQYVTHSSISPLTAPLGPYPFEIGRGRVTDENAPLTPIDPREPLLRAPHKLAADDFAGWVQERGLYFAERWDERYRPVFEAADPGEAAQRGAVLVARHGRGRYVYTGLAFFRQLPAGVPGAYRLLLNLLAGAPGSGP